MNVVARAINTIIGVNLLLLSVQQFRRLRDVRYVGRRDDHAREELFAAGGLLLGGKLGLAETRLVGHA